MKFPMECATSMTADTLFVSCLNAMMFTTQWYLWQTDGQTDGWTDRQMNLKFDMT